MCQLAFSLNSKENKLTITKLVHMICSASFEYFLECRLSPPLLRWIFSTDYLFGLYKLQFFLTIKTIQREMSIMKLLYNPLLKRSIIFRVFFINEKNYFLRLNSILTILKIEKKKKAKTRFIGKNAAYFFRFESINKNEPILQFALKCTLIWRNAMKRDVKTKCF